MDGRAVAAKVRAAVKDEVDELGGLKLATVLVGDDPASPLYISLKHKAAQEVGIEPLDLRLPADTSEEELLDLLRELNDDDEVDGILPQLPLPDGIDEARVIRAVDPVKDVDGFHPLNAGQLYLGRPTLVPATPRGVMALLEEYAIPLDGDVLVVAVGVAGLVDPEMVKQGAAVVDVGQNQTEAGLVGDVDAGVAERAAFLTPVPGGVGPMTIASLLRNTVRSARYRRGTLAFPRV